MIIVLLKHNNLRCNVSLKITTNYDIMKPLVIFLNLQKIIHAIGNVKLVIEKFVSTLLTLNGLFYLIIFITTVKLILNCLNKNILVFNFQCFVSYM